MPFKQILSNLVTGVPGASGAILADWEGEAVEHFCRYDDYELKLIGAHQGIILNQMREIYENFPMGEFKDAVISAERQRIILGAVGPDYLLVMTLSNEAVIGQAQFRFRKAVELLEKEIY